MLIKDIKELTNEPRSHAYIDDHMNFYGSSDSPNYEFLYIEIHKSDEFLRIIRSSQSSEEKKHRETLGFSKNLKILVLK